MINQIFAQNFVKQMSRQMDLKVNVMNERGVIIASADPERVGDFHMCAYEIIEQKLNQLITEKPTRDLIGVNFPGVNLRLVNHNETIGVIGVTGAPEKVLPLARMVKLTFETMYAYEYKRQKQASTRNDLNAFSFSLLLESPVNHRSIQLAAKKLELKDHYPRIPVYISIQSNPSALSFMEWYTASPFYHFQDILLPLDGNLLLCKAWDCKNIRDIRSYTEQFCLSLIHDFFSVSDIRARFYVSTPVSSFYDYHKIYNGIQFIISRTASTDNSVFYLNDYLLPIMIHECSDTLQPFLSWYCSELSKQTNTEQLLDTIEGLFQSDMKAEIAAQKLHLHKNSIFARLKRLREVIPLTPLSSMHDSILLISIAEMLRQKTSA